MSHLSCIPQKGCLTHHKLKGHKNAGEHQGHEQHSVPLTGERHSQDTLQATGVEFRPQSWTNGEPVDETSLQTTRWGQTLSKECEGEDK